MPDYPVAEIDVIIRNRMFALGSSLLPHFIGSIAWYTLLGDRFEINET